MIADAVVTIAFHYVERGMTAEKKLRELEANQIQEHHESDKAAIRAQNAATRAATHNQKIQKHTTTNGPTGKNYHIQQPKKGQ